MSKNFNQFLLTPFHNVPIIILCMMATDVTNPTSLGDIDTGLSAFIEPSFHKFLFHDVKCQSQKKGSNIVIYAEHKRRSFSKTNKYFLPLNLRCFTNRSDFQFYSKSLHAYQRESCCKKYCSNPATVVL